MMDIKEVSQDFQKYNKMEQCIVIYMKNDSKVAITSQVGQDLSMPINFLRVTEIQSSKRFVYFFSILQQTSTSNACYFRIVFRYSSGRMRS